MRQGRIAAFILTRNEEVQIERAIRSVRDKVDEIYVVDSLSEDRTVAIARSCGAEVLEREFVTYADQVNWAISQLPDDIEWALRLDADEYVCGKADIRAEINRLLSADSTIEGIRCRRSMVFMGKVLKFGGMHRKPVLRLFRHKNAACDIRLVDEHIRVQGPVRQGDIDIIDHDLKGFGFWMDKHKRYADLEARQFLKEKTFSATRDHVSSGPPPSLQQKKRYLYYALPPVLRPLGYFFYRYIVLGGVLDGYPGLRYSFFQAFWYRFLVEIRIRAYRNKNKRY